jgi:hypothetical protein
MKKLEVNQMENLQGGSSECMLSMFAYTDSLFTYNHDQSNWNLTMVGVAFGGMMSACG